MNVQRLRPGVKLDPYSGMPTGEDWATPVATDIPGHYVGRESAQENPTVNRDERARMKVLVRLPNVPRIEVLPGDRVRDEDGVVWDVASKPMHERHVDQLGVGLIDGPDAGTVWNLTLREG